MTKTTTTTERLFEKLIVSVMNKTIQLPENSTSLSVVAIPSAPPGESQKNYHLALYGNFMVSVQYVGFLSSCIGLLVVLRDILQVSGTPLTLINMCKGLNMSTRGV